MDIYRDIIEDPVFTAAAREIEPNPKRWDEIMEGVMWTIARNPQEGALVKKGSNLRLLFTRAFPGVPAMRILCEVESGDRCSLRHVSVVENAESETVIGG